MGIVVFRSPALSLGAARFLLGGKPVRQWQNFRPNLYWSQLR